MSDDTPDGVTPPDEPSPERETPPETPPEANKPPPPDFAPWAAADPSRRQAHPLALGCVGLLSVVGFIILDIAVISMTAGILPTSIGIAIGLAVSVALVVWMFLLRRKPNSSPYLGAVAVGATIALLLFGGCVMMISAMN